jgi:hypothetical protein
MKRIRASARSLGDPYVVVYVVILVLCSIPSKFLFYFAGPLALFLAARYRGFLSTRHGLFILTQGFVGSLSLLLEPSVAVLPSLLWPFTYGTFIVLAMYLLVSPRRSVTPATMQIVVQIATYWVFVQGLVGIIQYGLSGNPDGVAGTVGLLDFLGNITINQVYFGFAILSILPAIVFWPYRLRLRWFSSLIGLVAVGLSQSGHAIFAFLGAITLVYVVGAMRIRFFLPGVLVAILPFAIAVFLYSDSLNIAKNWYEKTLRENSPKMMMISQLLEDLVEDNKLFLLGSGPGQYLSRASLIGSGLLTNFQSRYQEAPDRLDENFIPIFTQYLVVGEGSAIAKPYNSFMSICSEWGALITFGVLCGMVILSVGNMIRARSCSSEEAVLRRYVAFYVVFLGAVAMVELYFEMPAAIAPGGWLAVVAMARARQLARSRVLGMRDALPLAWGKKGQGIPGGG